MKKEKVGSEKKEGAGVEKFWSALVKVYFQFYQMHFRDESGFGLSPTWNEATRGMESKGLKEIIKRLRGISEEKKIEWTEDVAKADLIYFFKKSTCEYFLPQKFYVLLFE